MLTVLILLGGCNLSVESFISEAKVFCDFLESSPVFNITSDSKPKYMELLSHLVQLYHESLTLPFGQDAINSSLGLSEDTDFDLDVLGYADDDMYTAASIQVPDIKIKFEYTDWMQDNQVALGRGFHSDGIKLVRLGEDLTSVYESVKWGVILWDIDDIFNKDHAHYETIYHLGFDFENKWGDFVIDAIKTLHYARFE